MQIITFINEFIKHPRNTGALTPSSEELAMNMIESINFAHSKTIVELGPGTGAFTEKLVRQKKKDTFLILIEINGTFVKELQHKYAQDPSVHVIHGSAENLKNYLEELNLEQVDFVLSGLPFASMPLEVSGRILQNVRDSLLLRGKFITFQYSLVKKKYIQSFFPRITEKRVWLNFPPAYVLSCEKGQEIR